MWVIHACVVGSVCRREMVRDRGDAFLMPEKSNSLFQEIFPNCLSSTVEGMGLKESAEKVDPVEVDSNFTYVVEDVRFLYYVPDLL